MDLIRDYEMRPDTVLEEERQGILKQKARSEFDVRYILYIPRPLAAFKLIRINWY